MCVHSRLIYSTSKHTNPVNSIGMSYQTTAAFTPYGQIDLDNIVILGLFTLDRELASWLVCFKLYFVY